MREKIYSLFTNPSDMTWQQILMNISAAAVLGIFIFVSYSISHRGTIYSKKFNASLVILTVLTGTVMTVIGNNIALSLGMVVIFILGCIKSDNRILLIVRADRAKQPMIKSQVYKLFSGKAILRVENTTQDTVELIYELTQKMVRNAEKGEINITDSIYKLENIEYVNLVMQNDEISN